MLSSMRVLALASQKGGAGKTTLAGHLAVEAARTGHGPVAMIDTDPQGSLYHWWLARDEEAPDDVVKLRGVPRRREDDQWTLAQDLAELRDDGIRLVIIDTPPAVTRRIRNVVSLADLVVLPVRPSPHDLRAVGATVDIVEAQGKPLMFVLNGGTPRARINQDAAIALTQHGPVAPVILHSRVHYASAMIDGRTVMETAPKSSSAKEVVGLWPHVNERLRRPLVVALDNGLDRAEAEDGGETTAPPRPAVKFPSPVAGSGLKPNQPFGRRTGDRDSAKTA